MASDAIKGTDGRLLISTTSGTPEVVGYVDSWSVSPSKDVQEVTYLGADSKEYVEGLISGTVSASGMWTLSSTHNQRPLLNQFMKVSSSTGSTTAISDSNIKFEGYLTYSTASGEEKQYVEADLISSGFSLEVSADSFHSFSYEGTVNGDMTYKIRSNT
jgi:hypothetical protein